MISATLPTPSASSPPVNVTTSSCFDLKVIDARPYHPCYNWNHSLVQCEIDWPCEVRQFLVSISPFISVTRGFLSYGTFFIILLGLFLNLLSLYTLVSSGLSKSGSGIYLVSLAICDCGNLIFNYAVGIARAHVPVFNDLFMESEWLCRWHGVFVEIFQLISAWIVVSFTMERCVAIWYPILLRNTSRTGRAKKSIGMLSGVLTLFSLSKLVLTGFEKDSVFGYAGCYSHRYRWHGVAYVRVAFQTWIPTTLVFLFNLLMFCKLRQIKKARKRLTEIKRITKRGPREGSFINRPSPTAPMLMAVSLAYLALVFPLGVVQTVELIWNVENPQPVYTVGDMVGRQQFIQWKNTKLLLKYLRSFFFGFYQINFCINFFLYFAAGLQFRLHLQKKVKRVFGRCGCCGGKRGEGGDQPEAATPGTSSTALDSRRGSQRRGNGQDHYQQQQKLQRRNLDTHDFQGEHDLHGGGVTFTIPSLSPVADAVSINVAVKEEDNNSGQIDYKGGNVEIVTVEVISCNLERMEDFEEISSEESNDTEEDKGIAMEALNASLEQSYQQQHMDESNSNVAWVVEEDGDIDR